MWLIYTTWGCDLLLDGFVDGERVAVRVFGGKIGQRAQGFEERRVALEVEPALDEALHL